MREVKRYRETANRGPEIFFEHEGGYVHFHGSVGTDWNTYHRGRGYVRYLRIWTTHGRHYSVKPGRRDVLHGITDAYFIHLRQCQAYTREKLWSAFWQQDFLTLLIKEAL